MILKDKFSEVLVKNLKNMYNLLQKEGIIMINDENLKGIIEDVIGNNDTYLNMIVYDIMKKVIDLPSETIGFMSSFQTRKSLVF